MQYLTIATLFFATAFAGVARRQAPAFCPPGLLYTVPQCCAVNVLGVADLDCVTPPRGPSNCKTFEAICETVGREPKCCAVPVAGQALLCVDPVGSNN
ncbi:fungal hydrophobin domain-containing protein [Trichoderma sp. SZMC 28014]